MKTLLILLTAVILAGCAAQSTWQAVLAPAPWIAPGVQAESRERTGGSMSGTRVERAWTGADRTVHDQTTYTLRIEDFLRKDAGSAALQGCLHAQKVFGSDYEGTVQIVSLDPLIALVYPTVRSGFWPATAGIDYITAPDGHAFLAIDAGPNAPATQPAAWFSPDLNVAPVLFPANAATLTIPFDGHSLLLTKSEGQWHTTRR